MKNNLAALVPFLYLITISSGALISDLNSPQKTQLDAMVKGVCGGRIGGCPTLSLGDEDELMDSESNRRMLAAQRKYISYDSLQRDFAPCGTPGSSYYNCRAGPANHYSRGCEVITRCARGD